MATLDEILRGVKDIENQLATLPHRLQISGAQVRTTKGLSELNENMGVLTAGELRIGNRLQPGDSFTGLRIGYPFLVYDTDYVLVAVDNDTLTFGIRADGWPVMGEGHALTDINGNSFLASTGSSTGTGGMTHVVYIGAATGSPPSSGANDPDGGGLIYVDGTELRWMDSDGFVRGIVTVGPLST